MKPLTIGSLFSGIGGLDLGIERGLASAGVAAETIWQVEQSDYCRRILSRHWPHAERYTDVRAVTAETVHPIDVLVGGFPCQDISTAGKGAGLAGEKSGLFFEMARIVCELEPRIVVMENVSAITSRGLDTVLGTMAALGYDARWGGLRASEVGAPHRRERWFCVAWLADTDQEQRRRSEALRDLWHNPERSSGEGQALADNDRKRGAARARMAAGRRSDLSDPDRGDGCGSSMADSIGSDIRSVPGGIRRPPGAPQIAGDQWERGGAVAGSRGEAQLAHTNGTEQQPPDRLDTGMGRIRRKQDPPIRPSAGKGQTQPEVGRGIAGIPARLDIPHRWPAPPGPQHDWEPPRTRPRQPHDIERLKALGNAVVPQCAAVIGHWIGSNLIESA